MFQDRLHGAGVAVVCDRWCCLCLVLCSRLPSFFTLPVRSICLVCSRLFLLWYLVDVPSAQQSWHEQSWLSLRSVQELPHQTASHCVSSLVHRYLWILSHCGESLWYVACLGYGVTVSGLCYSGTEAARCWPIGKWCQRETLTARHCGSQSASLSMLCSTISLTD